MDELKFNVIQCNDHIYISLVTKNNYYGTNIEAYRFDGNSPEKTNKSKWYRLSEVPTMVEQKQQDQYINGRYELKAGYPETELTPRLVQLDSLCDTQYEEVSGLYEKKYDKIEGEWESVPFVIDVIYKKDDFEWLTVNYPVKHALLDEIEFHPDLLQEAPCCADSQTMYKLIRDYVKSNINRDTAIITSDYDSHFEVKRKVYLAEPYNQTYNDNAFTKRKKPKWITKYINSKEETILNLKSKPSDNNYGDCTLAPAIYGANKADLDKKVKTYLKELMAEINIKYCECPHCKGWGIVKETENGTESIQ